MKKIIHAIKFFHRKDLVTPLAKELSMLIQDDITPYILLPIPMPYMRKVLRGYNQSELLAKELAKLVKREMRTDILLRKGALGRQVTRHSRKERLANQKNTFIVKGEVHGKHFLLVDDVTTTGATIQEARSSLLKKGALSVKAITIAH